ncbi:MAG: DUF4254 domain-containing protein, partial [Prevotella sp.]|nr:DUF4254 domain-containing protein [Prevotella sp.]
YHMKAEVERTDVGEEHKAKCQAKLNVLLEQNTDLGTAIAQLLEPRRVSMSLDSLEHLRDTWDMKKAVN